MVNREHMEQWAQALEAYDREPARGMLSKTGLDGEVKMCAVGIGLHTMNPAIRMWCVTENQHDWHNWIGIDPMEHDPFDVPLKDDGSGWESVVLANDLARQSPWTIAQRLRETYLKEES